MKTEYNKKIATIGRNRELSTHFFKYFKQRNHGDVTKYGKKDRRSNSIREY